MLSQFTLRITALFRLTTRNIFEPVLVLISLNRASLIAFSHPIVKITVALKVARTVCHKKHCQPVHLHIG